MQRVLELDTVGDHDADGVAGGRTVEHGEGPAAPCRLLALRKRQRISTLPLVLEVQGLPVVAAAEQICCAGFGLSRYACDAAGRHLALTSGVLLSQVLAVLFIRWSRLAGAMRCARCAPWIPLARLSGGAPT